MKHTLKGIQAQIGFLAERSVASKATLAKQRFDLCLVIDLGSLGLNFLPATD
jgi:hypothetical protein